MFVSKKNGAYEESQRFAVGIADQLMAAGLNFTTHHEEQEQRHLMDRSRGIYQYDELAVLRLTEMPAVLLEAGVIVNRDEELNSLHPRGAIRLLRP